MYDMSRGIWACPFSILPLKKPPQYFRSNNKYQIYSEMHKGGDMTSNIVAKVIVQSQSSFWLFI